MRDTWTPPEALALGSDQNESQLPSPADPVPEAHQLQPQHPQQTPAAQHPLLGTAPEQQYQLQSQFAGRPLQSPATPAWGTDRIAVKEEPLDDKNNDSGISPGHYTSDSNCNGSLSPSSSIGELPITQNGFNYSPQRRYHSPDFINNNYDINRSADIVSSTTNTKGDKKSQLSAEVSPDPLQCPLCTFSTQLRLHFAEHLALHCSAGEEHIDQFRTSIVSQLMNKGQVVKPDEKPKPKEEPKLPTDEKTEEEEHDPFFDEPGVRVPRVNGQGKVKIFRCKQCPFVAISKLDFWGHCRVHIKPEKLLTCPKCPFVTEYKHHLEYHFRNHFGSKPFQCDQCNYSCVNKSMLNSHLKSHSNVYQFRCSDCAYATKYCHSLKLHLRKYSHHPAMVLNADGTPNPLPIIDVYGTRRGPKAKPKKEKQPHNERPLSPTPTSPNCFAQSPSSPIQAPSSMPNLSQSVVPYQMNSELLAKFNFNPFNGVTMPNAMAISQAMSMQQAMPMSQAIHMQQAMQMPQGMANLMSFPFNPMMAVLMPNPMLFGNSGANAHMNEKQMVTMKAAMMEYASNLAKNMEAKTAEEMSKASFQEPGAGVANMPTPDIESQQYEPDSSDVGALDLSKSEAFEDEDQPMNMTTLNFNYSQVPIVAPNKSIKNRRKGPAIRLDRRVMTNDSDDDMAAED